MKGQEKVSPERNKERIIVKHSWEQNPMRTPQGREKWTSGAAVYRDALLGYLTSHFTAMVKWPIDTLCFATSSTGKRHFLLTDGSSPAITSTNLRSYLSSSFLTYNMRKLTSQCLWRWNETLKTRNPGTQRAFHMGHALLLCSSPLTTFPTIFLSPASIPLLSNPNWMVRWRGDRGTTMCDELTGTGHFCPISAFSGGRRFYFFSWFWSRGLISWSTASLNLLIQLQSGPFSKYWPLNQKNVDKIAQIL